MNVNSTGYTTEPGMYSLSIRSGDVEAAERRPDNEATETLRIKAPLADGQGMKIDLLA